VEHIGGTIHTVGLDTLNPFELDAKSGQLDFNSKSQLQIMLSHFHGLLRDRSKIDTNDKSNKTKALKALWHDKLAELDGKYKLQSFIQSASDIKEDHKHFVLISRIFDIIDLIREDESMHDQTAYLQKPNKSAPTRTTTTKSGV
jgi:hypothetical protein